MHDSPFKFYQHVFKLLLIHEHNTSYRILIVKTRKS